MADPESAEFAGVRRANGGGAFFRLVDDVKDAVVDSLREDPLLRVRVRDPADRAQDQIIDLAVLNAKLRGDNPTIVRNRLETLRKHRTTWDRIHAHVAANDARVTIEDIEALAEAIEKVELEQRDERISVGESSEELRVLEERLASARANLAYTERRLRAGRESLDALEDKTVTLNRSFADQGGEILTSLASGSDAPRAAEFTEMPLGDRLKVPRAVTANTIVGVAEASTSETSGVPADSAKPRRRARVRELKERSDLTSTLELEPAIREYWTPVAFSAHLAKGDKMQVELFDEPWVLFRGESGSVAALYDECAHRACPLSLGEVKGERISCAYHGWEFGARGACEHMPSTKMCRGVSVRALPVREEGGFIWAWPGVGEPDGDLPACQALQPPSDKYKVHAEIQIEVPVEHGLLVENLLDLAHAPFTHTGTFAKGWPIPDAVKFKTTEALAGLWNPYPIDMAFEPPCMTVSHIGIAQPGKVVRNANASDCKNHLHQVHVCIPAGKGKTRLLYRMSMDVLGWMAGMPGTDKLWRAYADAVLGEDLVLVVGQQEAMQRGGDTWRHPVSYDKLAVRYRRWRNVDAGKRLEERESLAMSAGQLFAADESSTEAEDDTEAGDALSACEPADLV
jgi:chlorophyllide a oxygenase